MSVMRAVGILVMALLASGFSLQDQGAGQASVPMRFVSVDVLIDPAGEALAAWQVRVEDRTGAAKLVGVEGGEDAAFAAPPHHDPRALSTGAVVLAAFDETDAGLTGETRVARLSFAVEGNAAPEFNVTTVVVASPDGPIPAATTRLLR